MNNVSAPHPPLTPPSCDLRDFPFMPLDVARLRSSDLAATASHQACWAAVLLWSAAWHQVPASSIPNDDRVQAQLAGYGRDLRGWAKVRADVLRSWVACSDGRLYHPVVAEKALEAWLEKLAARISSGQGNAKRWGISFNREPIDAAMAAARALLVQLNPQSRALNKRRTLGVQGAEPQDPDGIPAGSQRDRNRQGQGQGQGSINSVPEGTGADAPAATKPKSKAPPDPVKQEIWSTALPLLVVGKATRADAASFLGGLVKDYGQVVLLEAVRSADKERPFDAKEYLTACCLRAAGRRLTPVAGGQAARIADFHAELNEIRAEINGTPTGETYDQDAIDVDARVVPG